MLSTTKLRFDLDQPIVRHSVAFALGWIALLLHLWHIDLQPLWLDEAMSAHIAHEPNGLAFIHNTPPLYFWLLRGWTDWFGVDAAGMRSLSAVAGAGFVWASFYAARCMIGNTAALLAAGFALASPIHIYYSQEARAYSLLLFALMLAVWMLWRLAERPRIGVWLLVVLASSAALYTHYLASILLAFAYVAVIVIQPAARRFTVFKTVAAAAAATAILLLPWLLWWWLVTPFTPSDMSWLGIVWSRLTGLDAFADSIELLLVGGQAERTPVFLKQFSSMPFSDAARITALASAATIMVLAMVQLRHATQRQRRNMLAIGALFAGPLLALWLVSFLHPMYCPGRYDLIAFPGGILMLAGAASMASDTRQVVASWLTTAAVVVLGTVLLAKDWRYFQAAAGSDPHRNIASHLAANATTNETVILCGTTGVSVLAYLYQDGFIWQGGRCKSSKTEFGCRLLPASLEAAPASVSRYYHTIEDGTLPQELASMLPLKAAAGIWFVMGDDLRPKGKDDPIAGLTDQLLQVLHRSNYVVESTEPALGIAHLVPRL